MKTVLSLAATFLVLSACTSSQVDQANQAVTTAKVACLVNASVVTVEGKPGSTATQLCAVVNGVPTLQPVVSTTTPATTPATPPVQVPVSK